MDNFAFYYAVGVLTIDALAWIVIGAISYFAYQALAQFLQSHARLGHRFADLDIKTMLKSLVKSTKKH